jgi:hypothetical protein
MAENDKTDEQKALEERIREIKKLKQEMESKKELDILL